GSGVSAASTASPATTCSGQIVLELAPSSQAPGLEERPTPQSIGVHGATAEARRMLGETTRPKPPLDHAAAFGPVASGAAASLPPKPQAIAMLAANGTIVLDSSMPTESVGHAIAGEERTLAALWQNAAAAQHQGPAYLEQSDGDWRETSWQEAAQRVDELAQGLLARGVGKGDRIAILGPSCLDWALLDFALLSIGSAVVPIYPTSSPSEITYIIENSEARGIV